MRDLRAATAFLTPFGTGTHDPTPSTLRWFPCVGAAIGATTGGAWRTLRSRGSPASAAAATVALECALTGALHLDGLADSADGLFAHAPSKQRLDIMAEPQVGTFAVVAVSVALVAKTAALTDLAPSALLVAGLGCASRSIMVLGAQLLPYARAQGLASAFLDDRPSPSGAPASPSVSPASPSVMSARTITTVVAVGGIVAAVAAGSMAKGRAGAAAVLTGAATGAGVLGLARRRLGGFTGDILGAAGVACETVGLVTASLLGGGTGRDGAAAADRTRPRHSNRGRARRETRR